MIKTTVTNMNRRAFCATLWTLVLSTMSITAPVVSAKDGGETTRSKTCLTGPSTSGPAPYGHAEIRTESDRNRSRLNVEVEDVNLAAGTMLDVMVDHAGTRMKVGTIKLDAQKSGELELNSQDGDSVPAVQKGDIVIVMSADVAILTGVF